MNCGDGRRRRDCRSHLAARDEFFEREFGMRGSNGWRWRLGGICRDCFVAI